MPAAELSHPLGITFVLAVACTLSQTALAGHEQLVAQHRFVHAELIGALYLPDHAEAVIATEITPRTELQRQVVITANHACDELDGIACDTGIVAP